MKKVCTTIFVLLILALDSNLALSQVFGGSRSGAPATSSSTSNIGSANPSAYYYGRGEGVLIDVNLWGQVGKPGKYFVPYTTNLISLISIAGGPTDQAKLDEVRIVRYSQRDTTVIERIARVNITRFIEYGEQSHIPPLVRGDTVIVPGDALSVFQTFVSIASSVSVILNTFFLIAIMNNRI